MNALDFYRSILPAAGLDTRTVALPVPTDTGTENVDVANVWYMLGKEPEVLTVEGNVVVLPERSLLRLGIPETITAFHPVCESPLRKDSPVFTRLQRCFMIRMNYIIAELIYGLAQFAATTDKHISASPAQAHFLAENSKVDAAALKFTSKVLEKLRLTEPAERLISINTRRNVPREDRSHSRGCLVNFPINEFRKNSDNVLGVSASRERNRECFYALLDWIFPDCTTLNAYSGYSDDLKAPSLAALLTAAGKIYGRINAVVDVFASQLTNPESLKTDLTFLAGIDNLTKFRNELGELPGNLGEPLDVTTQGESTAVVADRFAVPKDVVRPKAPQPPVAASVLPAPVAKPTTAGGSGAKPLAASVVGTLPAAKTPVAAQPQKSWLDLQEENRQIHAMQHAPQAMPQYQQPVAYAQPQYLAQPQAQPQQMVQLQDPNTGHFYLVPANQLPQQQVVMQPQQQVVMQTPYGYPQQQQYATQQYAMQQVNTNGFQGYGPPPTMMVPQGYANPGQVYYQQPTVVTSPGRANAMMRGYGRR